MHCFNNLQSCLPIRPDIIDRQNCNSSNKIKFNLRDGINYSIKLMQLTAIQYAVGNLLKFANVTVNSILIGYNDQNWKDQINLVNQNSYIICLFQPSISTYCHCK